MSPIREGAREEATTSSGENQWKGSERESKREGESEREGGRKRAKIRDKV